MKTDRQADGDRQTERERDRQRQRETEIDRDRQTDGDRRTLQFAAGDSFSLLPVHRVSCASCARFVLSDTNKGESVSVLVERVKGFRDGVRVMRSRCFWIVPMGSRDTLKNMTENLW
ncbi:unnamed protein product [Pleuronectes platessa]|uniref:Uncharacterized protein n=1 Tax=Pleuronectes platessa TaxID=8262 RepID=A0A9N7UST3_PLEPL|nr:unnamed protein product [Pleuronectes platessa]